MSIHKGLKFFATQPHECSYLPDEQAITLFIDPDTTVNQSLYSNLTELGFRRSGQHIYRPHCENCQACIPLRIPVKRFAMRRTQRKNWKQNADLKVSICKAEFTDEYYDLYDHYIRQCHNDGDMFPPSVEQFCNFLADAPEFCKFYEFRLDGKLLAVSVVDEFRSGLSAIYTFYDPQYSKRSLGRYCILWLIEHARTNKIPYLHLGYWIRNCRKMNYKIEYRPTELYINQHWAELR